MAEPRQYFTQQVHYLRKSVTFADMDTRVTVGVVPSGALLIQPISGFAVTTTFDGTTVVDMGTLSPTDDDDEFLSAGVTTALGFVAFDEAISHLVTADTTITVNLADSGTATQGEGEAIVCYIPDNDG